MDFYYYYDTAQICEGGHTCNLTVNEHPESNQKFCPGCNAKVISTCPKCNTPIRGLYVKSWEESIQNNKVYDPFDCSYSTASITKREYLTENYVVPAYCQNCGAPYPWTQAILLEGEGIIDILYDLTLDQKEQLKSFIPDLLVEKPGNRLAALKTSIIINACKAGGKDLFINFLKEYIIQSLFVLMHLK